MAPVRPILLCVKNNNSVRNFSTSAICWGMRNFRKIVLHGFRGDRRYKERMKTNPDPDIKAYDYGIRQPGYTHNGKFHLVPEMIPDLIVPDLKGFELQPYVSYNVQEVYQEEFTARDLFNAIYSEKIKKDFNENKLDENGNSLEPNELELMTSEEAKKRARQTGSDYFSGPPPTSEELKDW